MPNKRISVSIVVPVYNVSKYLTQCLNSIANQTLKKIEVIVIDDGSTDDSSSIADDFAKKDSRFVVIHQANAGYSAAVNRGIKLAKGQYIGIVESDDYIEPTMYEKLYSCAIKNQADIVKGGFYKYNSTLPKTLQDEYYVCPSGIDLRKAPKRPFSVDEWPNIIAFHSSIWSSIYKSDLIKNCLIPESAGASYQDFPFMLSILTKASQISVVPTGFYHWRNDPNQTHSTSVKGEKALLMVKNSKAGIDIVKKSHKYDSLKEALYIHVLWTNLPFLLNIESKYRKTYYNKLRQLLSPIKSDPTFKYAFFRPRDKVIFNLIVSGHYALFVQYLNATKLYSKLKKFIKH